MCDRKVSEYMYCLRGRWASCFGVQSPNGKCLGQMAVELAVLLPVVLIISLIAAQAFKFLLLTQDFSIQARAAVFSCACSTSLDALEIEHLIEQRIREGMEDDACVVRVSASSYESQGDAIFSLVAQPVVYHCELSYEPWYPHAAIDDVDGSHPTPFVFALDIIVDPYKSGVVM